MSLEQHIKNVFTVLRPKRKWKTIYWMVDVHGVIIPGSWDRGNELRFLTWDCVGPLWWISDRKDQRLILWTSSYPEELNSLCNWLFTFGIKVDYVNQNPDEQNTEYADFAFKPYFNILIDDKAGFIPETDWAIVKQVLMKVGEWDNV